MTRNGAPTGADTGTRRFEALFHENYRRVLAYALRRAADRESAEEVVSETFLVAWRRFDSVPEEPLPWLLGTARKLLANERRAARRRSPAGPHASLDAVEVDDRRAPLSDDLAERAAFAAAFRALADRDREVLSLLAWDGLRAREAAKVLGCSPAAFSLRLHRARRRFRNELEANGHSFGERGRSTRLIEKPGTTEGR